MAEPGLPDAVWPAALFLAGLIAGSFLATLVIRWPQGRSVASGRSACDGCGRPLTVVDLVPLMGALLARGRCRALACGAAIDPRHWWIELGCGVVGALAGWTAPGWVGAGGALFGWPLIALAA
ncbi:prepilin peptidase, partial [Sphingomonas bacterium]|uniref:prepilin peptidase n=1 Tax=Sphingomonas bacterium TaxID=1895847 RepID=UPI0015760514